MFEDQYGKRAKSIISQSMRSLLDLIFPPRCHICGMQISVASQSNICKDCLTRLPFIKSPYCWKCGCSHEDSAGGNDRLCRDCLKKRPPFDSARSLLKYHSPVPDILHRLKYKSDSSVIGAISAILEANGTIQESRECQLILPVPLHVKRLRQRGCNQSLLLARLAFSGYQEKISVNLLVRAKNTTSQTGLSGGDRRRNLKDAFQVRNQKVIEGASVCLVDDVYTTGTTVSECTKILKKNGAREVHVWTFARV